MRPEISTEISTEIRTEMNIKMKSCEHPPALYPYREWSIEEEHYEDEYNQRSECLRTRQRLYRHAREFRGRLSRQGWGFGSRELSERLL